MAEEKKELSMSEISTHDSKDSAWLVIKDMNDGGEPESVENLRLAAIVPSY